MTITIKFFIENFIYSIVLSMNWCRSMEWLIIASLGILAASLAQVYYFKRSERRVKRLKREFERLEREIVSL